MTRAHTKDIEWLKQMKSGLDASYLQQIEEMKSNHQEEMKEANQEIASMKQASLLMCNIRRDSNDIIEQLKGEIQQMKYEKEREERLEESEQRLKDIE